MIKLTLAPKKWRPQMKNDAKFRAEEEKRTAEYEVIKALIESQRSEQALVREGVTENMKYARQVVKTARWCPRRRESLPTIEKKKKKTGTANQEVSESRRKRVLRELS